jgi:hypothetical protein
MAKQKNLLTTYKIMQRLAQLLGSSSQASSLPYTPPFSANAIFFQKKPALYTSMFEKKKKAGYPTDFILSPT